jgi:cyclase
MSASGEYVNKLTRLQAMDLKQSVTVHIMLRRQSDRRESGQCWTLYKEGQAMDKQVSIMPCLDMQNARVVKGVHFVDIRDAGDPVECAKAYCRAGADELALLDITATVENRPTMLEVVRNVAAVTTIPFTVGGGISDVASAAAVLEAGANKVSTSSAAFRKPDIIPDMIKEFGADKVTVAVDVDINASLPSGYEVYIDGGRTATGSDALEWAKKVDGYGVPVILPTSKAGDGAQTGFDLPVIRAMAEACSAEIVASGGAGKMEHFYDAVEAGATILLAASVFHFRLIDIGELKDYLRSQGVEVK